MDEIDRKILRTLQYDPEISMRDLAEITGLSHTPCWRRINRMRDEGIISERRYLLDEHALGFEIVVFCYVRMKEHTRDHLNGFEKAVLGVPEVMQCYLVTGDEDYLLRVLAKSMNHYEETIKNTLVELPNVASVTTSVTLKEVKNTSDVPV